MLAAWPHHSICLQQMILHTSGPLCIMTIIQSVLTSKFSVNMLSGVCKLSLVEQSLQVESDRVLLSGV